MDIRMPVMNDVLCTKAVKEQYPDVKVSFWRPLMTMNLSSLLKYSASSCILKGFRQKSFASIQTVYQGEDMINQYCYQGLQNLSQMAQSNFAITVTGKI